MSVSFAEVANASSYEIQYSTSSKFSKVTTVKGSELKYTIKKLTGKKTYYVRVRGVNDEGSGSWSAVKKIKIKK
jgi:hypothetical protein